MAISVGGIEASLEIQIGDFLRKMDQAEKRLDRMGEKAEDVVEQFEKIGPKFAKPFIDGVDEADKKSKQFVANLDKLGKQLAAIGAVTTTAFGLAFKSFNENQQAINRLRSSAAGLGDEFDGVEKRAAPLVDSLESLGAPGGGSDELFNTLARLVPALRDESDAFSVLELSARLAANGLGDVGQVSNAIIAALSGNADQLVRLDRSLLPVSAKWDRLAESIGKTRSEIGKSNEILNILRERSKVVPELTAWQEFAIIMNKTRESVGEVIAVGLEPLFKLINSGLRFLKEFSETGLGRIVIQGTAAAGVLALVAGGVISLGTQIATGAAALKALGISGTVASAAFKTFGVFLLRTVALLALLEIALRAADFLNKSEEFRVAVQKQFASIAFVAEKVKASLGKGNDDLAESYRRIATGQIKVGDEELKGVSIKEQLINVQKELNEAISSGNTELGEEIDFAASLEKTLKSLADAEAKEKAEKDKVKSDLAAARAAAKAEREREEREQKAREAIRFAEAEKERRLLQRDILEKIALQKGHHEEVIALQKGREAESIALQRAHHQQEIVLLEERRSKLLADIESRHTAGEQATNDELAQRLLLNERIDQLNEELNELLKSPWEKATESVISFGEFSQNVVSSVQGIASGLAETFASTLVGGITSARQSMGQLFSQFMKQIAAMIARAVVLSAIMSVFGFGSFGGNLGKFFGKGAAAGASGSLTGASGGGLIKPGGGFFGHDDPANDQLARGEGSRIVDLLLSGMSSRAGQMGGVGDALSSSGVSSSGVGSFAPVVEVHEATEMTWVRVTDRHIEPRIRERLDRQTVRS